LLVAEVHGGEAVQRHVGGVCAIGLDQANCCIGCLGAVALEPGLAAHPVGALLGDGALGQLVAQLNLELAAVQAALAVELGDVEFLALFANLVGDLAGREGGRGEDEVSSSIFSSSAFSASKAYIEKHEAAIFSRARLQRRLEVVTQQAGDVVNQFHEKCRLGHRVGRCANA
jgi:hypothetical protein